MYGKLTRNNKGVKAPVTALRSKRSGFTLTEVIVASTILALAMVPVLRGLTNAHRTSVIIERKTKSLFLAQSKLDDIKARLIYNYSSDFSENDTSLEESYLCNVDDSPLSTDLRSITVFAGFDQDRNSNLDSDEVCITLATKVAKR